MSITTTAISAATTSKMERHSRAKKLSSAPKSREGKQKNDERYKLKNSGPAVQEKAAKLSGRAINNVPERAVSLPLTGGNRPTIVSNVRPAVGVGGSETSVSGITSAADQYNSYRFDEVTALKTYKKMMTLHLKEDMFRKLKFITNDAMLDYSKSPATLCGYVCAKMRVPDFQWAEYWVLVRHTTKKMIEQQRTNATSAVKKGFKGTK